MQKNPVHTHKTYFQVLLFTSSRLRSSSRLTQSVQRPPAPRLACGGPTLCALSAPSPRLRMEAAAPDLAPGMESAADETTGAPEDEPWHGDLGTALKEEADAAMAEGEAPAPPSALEEAPGGEAAPHEAVGSFAPASDVAAGFEETTPRLRARRPSTRRTLGRSRPRRRRMRSESYVNAHQCTPVVSGLQFHMHSTCNESDPITFLN